MQLGLRLALATSLVVNAVVHLQLWSEGYRSIAIIGTLFLVSVVAGGVLAAGIALTRFGAVALAAAGYAVASLGALAVSRTSGLFGFTEVGLDRRAMLTLGSEVVTLVAVAMWFTVTSRQHGAPRLLGARVDDRG